MIDGIVGEVLFWSLQRALGPECFTSSVKNAWVKVYNRLIRTIVPVAVGLELHGSKHKGDKCNSNENHKLSISGDCCSKNNDRDASISYQDFCTASANHNTTNPQHNNAHHHAHHHVPETVTVITTIATSIFPLLKGNNHKPPLSDMVARCLSHKSGRSGRSCRSAIEEEEEEELIDRLEHDAFLSSKSHIPSAANDGMTMMMDEDMNMLRCPERIVYHSTFA